jgi:hypothetical protein
MPSRRSSSTTAARWRPLRSSSPGSKDGDRRVDAHAARVGTTVAVERALVVLAVASGTSVVPSVRARSEHSGPSSISSTTTVLPGLAKAAREALAHASEGLVGRVGHDDALASSKAVGLHHAGAGKLLHVGCARTLIREALPGCRRHACLFHHMLRELLRALHLGRLGIRSEDRDASCTHSVADALDEGRLRADHDEADSVLFRECCHPPQEIQDRALPSRPDRTCHHCPAPHRSCRHAETRQASRAAHARGRPHPGEEYRTFEFSHVSSL